jgi:hypothetical protein
MGTEKAAFGLNQVHAAIIKLKKYVTDFILVNLNYIMMFWRGNLLDSNPLRNEIIFNVL